MKIQKVIKMIEKIKPAIQLISEEQIFQEPKIGHEIQVESCRMTCSYYWSSSEVLSSPKQFKEIIGLHELIPSLIDVDYKGLEMPMYL